MNKNTIVWGRTIARVGVILVLLISNSLLFSGCSREREVISLGNGVALQGKILTEKTAQMYEKIKKFRKHLNDEMEVFHALTNVDLNISPPFKHNPEYLKEILFRQKAFETLGKVYSEFNKLSDSNYAKNASEAFSAFSKSVNSLKDIPAIPSPLTKGISLVTEEKIKFLLGSISVGFQARNIKQQNFQVSRLSEAFANCLKSEGKVWKIILNDEMKRFENSFSGVGDSAFDLERINKKTDQPFLPKYDVALYRIQKLREEKEKLADIEKDFAAISESFEKLQEAHSEIGKKKPVLKNITITLESIGELLEGVK